MFLKEWRTHLNMTLEDVADAVGSNKGEISKIERGIKRYNEDHITKFCDAFGIEPFQLFFRPEEQLLDSLLSGKSDVERELAFRVVSAALGSERKQ